MARQAPNPLTLVPREPFPGLETMLYRTPGRSLTREEQQVQVERDIELAVIGATKELGEIGTTGIADLYLHAFGEFSRASGDILAIKDAATGPEHQLYLDAFSKQLLPRLAHHTTGLIEVTAHAIARELHRSKHPEPPQPAPLSLLERIFGRRV